MVTLCSKHKNGPSKGQIGRGKHPKRRKIITHGTNSGILRVLFCVPGGLYRPEFLKLNLAPECQALIPNDRGVGLSVLTNRVLVGVPDLTHQAQCNIMYAA
jgi:hypothetical protein